MNAYTHTHTHVDISTNYKILKIKHVHIYVHVLTPTAPLPVQKSAMSEFDHFSVTSDNTTSISTSLPPTPMKTGTAGEGKIIKNTTIQKLYFMKIKIINLC